MKFAIEQQEFYDAVTGHTKEVYFLGGRAGTGKTTLVASAQRHLVTSGDAVLALYPSHQARKIGVSSYGPDHNDRDIRFQTIHSFIGTRMLNVDPDSGESSFRDKFHTDATVDESSIGAFESFVHDRSITVFVDEVSMISTVQMKKLISMLDASCCYVSIVILGDFSQLPPPMGASCELYLADLVSDREYLDVELTKIWRTDLQEIHALCERIRKGKALRPYTVQGVEVLSDPKSFMNAYLDDVKSGADVCALAYRNRTVYRYTKMAAAVLTGDPDPIQEGFEYFCASSVGTDQEVGNTNFSDEIGLYNGDPVTCHELLPSVTISEPWAGGLTMEVTPAIVKSDSGRMFKVNATLYSEHNGAMSSGVERYLTHMKDLCLEGKQVFANNPKVASIWQGLDVCSKNLKVAITNHPTLVRLCRSYDQQFPPSQAAYKLSRLLWGVLFYRHKGQFLLLRSKNAMTAHSAQGGSRDIVYVDSTDFTKCPKSLKKKLLYTSVSRGRKKVVVLIQP